MPRVDPFISVVLPILNEEETMERLARSLLDQDYPRDCYEVVMADGGSTDATHEILRRVDRDGRIRVLPNPGRTAPAALNVAIAATRGEIVTRVDGHSWVAPDYLSRIVSVMEETGESVVGGPVLMEPDTPFRRALVEALYSPAAVGSVPYRTLRSRTHVASLQTGSFRRSVFDRVGPFDEALAVGQDLDMNTRIRKAGFKLLLDPSIRFWYIPRGSLQSLWRQIYSVGLVKAPILRKHPDIFRVKYVVPTILVLALALAVLTIPWGGGWFLAAYAVAITAVATSRVHKLGMGAVRLLAIVPVLHVGYGIGFLIGAIGSLTGRPIKPPGAP